MTMSFSVLTLKVKGYGLTLCVLVSCLLKFGLLAYVSIVTVVSVVVSSAVIVYKACRI